MGTDMMGGASQLQLLDSHSSIYTYNVDPDLFNESILNRTVNETSGQRLLAMDDSFLRAAILINEYYLWVIFAVGFPGNLATIVTICRMRHLGSFVLYVVLLATTDNLAISLKILFYHLLLNKVDLGSTGCRLLEFLGNFLITYCNWVLVMMAIERVIAVRYPFKIQFQSCLTFRKAAIAITAVGIIIAGMYVPILWVSTYDDKLARCTKKDHTLVSAIHWLSISMYAFIPFIVLNVCNFLIAREIRLSFRLRNSFKTVHSFVIHRRACDVPVQRQIMLMLFAATFMFLLLHFPICAFLLADSYWTVTEHTKAYAVKYFCSQLAYVLCDSNHAFNFYLYFLSARKFRTHFTHMFSSCPRLCKRPGRRSRGFDSRRHIGRKL